jgi:hypothetical protein
MAKLLAMASGADEPGVRTAILDYAREPHRATAPAELDASERSIRLVTPNATVDAPADTRAPTPTEAA